MSDRNDDQFDKYLRSFRPLDPEPLPIRAKKHTASANSRAALVASVVACLAAIAFVVIVLPHGSKPSYNQAAVQIPNKARHDRISTPTLTRLALDDDTAFDEVMTDETEAQFPPMNSEQSALRVLAKE